MKEKAEYTEPYLIEFGKHGQSNQGFISVSENHAEIPFIIERVFWTYFTPEDVVRGRHAHYQTQQVLIAVAGRIIVTLEDKNREIHTYVLDSPNKGVYIPASCWHTMQYSHNAVQMVLASTKYLESDYIRDYADFVRIYGKDKI